VDYDLKISGGTIIDGTGAARYKGDIGISNGKIDRA
jgi:N-acyl-D-aspartate/D-glutamate deacylase